MKNIEYYEKIKGLKPLSINDSLHVSMETYHINDKIIEVYFIIGDNDPSEINVFDKETYKTPYERLQELLKTI